MTDDSSQTSITTAVIMAAGRGTRMKELTDHVPKALLEVDGKPFAIHILERLQQAGLTRVIFVTGYKRERFDEIRGAIPQGLEVRFVNQFERIPAEKYGTAIAILAAEPEVSGGPFVALAGDHLFSVRDLVNLRTFTGEFHVMGAFPSDHPQDFGVVITENGNVLKEILEKPKNPPGNLVNISFYCFTPDVFPALKRVKKSERGEYELTDAINELARARRVRVIRLAEPTVHISNPEDINAAHAFVTDGR